MNKIAVIGLGIMGHGIADNFLKNGYEVMVWNRTSNKAADLIEKGAKHAKSIKEAVEDSDLIFEVTANDESSKEIWLSDEGIINYAKPEQYLITSATLSVKWIDDLAANNAAARLQFFDMPMTGGRKGAESGQLILLVGGSKDGLDRIAEDLKAVAKDVKYFGKAGSGMRYKLILNTLQSLHIAGFGEALKMAKRAGLDENLVGSTLAERPGGVVTNQAWTDYQKDPEPINFSVEWVYKDLGYAADMANGIHHPLLDEVLSLYKNAMNLGYDQADWTKINKLPG